MRLNLFLVWMNLDSPPTPDSAQVLAPRYSRPSWVRHHAAQAVAPINKASQSTPMEIVESAWTSEVCLACRSHVMVTNTFFTRLANERYNGNAVQIYDCNGSSAQRWVLNRGAGQGAPACLLWTCLVR